MTELTVIYDVLVCESVCRKDENIKKNANYFATDSDDGGDLDEDNNTDQLPPKEKLLPTPFDACSNKRLPNPLLDSTEEDEESHSSVFVNYYHRAEQAKLAVLEQHVKLTATKDPTVNGHKDTKKRQMCQNFLRGRCRYANKCRFAHSAEAGTEEVSGSNVPSESSKPAHLENTIRSHLPASHNQYPFDYAEELDLNNDDDEDENRKRKKRTGINDTLVPPKRSLQSLEKQRMEERPWTVKHK